METKSSTNQNGRMKTGNALVYKQGTSETFKNSLTCPIRSKGKSLDDVHEPLGIKYSAN